eukprot:m.308153 g.308153  ORF g.308153 m.308153 type:complete len:452 (+) comp43463_c0_seq1:212-1567(+)
MSQGGLSDSDLAVSVSQSDSFWEVGNYKRVVKRIDDGAKLCDELVQLVTERAEIEAKYAGRLTKWKKKWEEVIEKGPEYGTMESALKAVMSEAEQLSDIHTNMKEQLISQVAPSVQQWKADHYHKHFFHFKEMKAAEEGFDKAQRPWAKRLAKVEKYKKLYHSHSKQAEQALRQANDAERDAAISPEQCKKLKDKAEKARNVQYNTKARYHEKLRDIDSYNPTYINDMEAEFQKCQDFERLRLEFFKNTVLMYKQILDLSVSSQFGGVYQQFQGAIGSTSSLEDLEWYSTIKGAKMPMNWPHFEEFSGTVEESQSQSGQGNLYVTSSRRGTGKSSPRPSPNTARVDRSMISAPVKTPLGASYGESQEDSDEEFVEPPPEPTEPDSGAGGNGDGECPVRALYDYDGQENDELTFSAGDVLTKLEDEDEQGWCKGRLNGRVGLYPANYVEPIY